MAPLGERKIAAAATTSTSRPDSAATNSVSAQTFAPTSAPTSSSSQCACCRTAEPPARCSRCLAVWYCGPKCQQQHWREHKVLCGKAKTSMQVPTEPSRSPCKSMDGWVSGESAQKLLESLPGPTPATQEKLMSLMKQGQHLDALGEALSAQLFWTPSSSSTAPPPTAQPAAPAMAGPSAVAAAQVAGALWNKIGFRPIPPERHEYSLLHADPPASASSTVVPAAAQMTPFALDPESSQDDKFGVPRRHPPELVGFRCPEVDVRGCSQAQILEKLRPFLDIRNPMPCIIKNLPLFDRAVEAWDVDYLRQHMGDQLYHTFASHSSSRRFAYFFDERNEGNYEAPPIAEARKMTFGDFVEKQREESRVEGSDYAYYLQTPVLRYQDGKITSAKFDDRMDADLRTMNQGLMEALADAGNFGPISRNQLFVSFSDYLTATHYDQQQNLFLQIRGAKRFLLFEPKLLPALCAYPTHHPLDRKARLDLEDMDFDAFPKARALIGRGVEATIEQGDILFLPMSWFHHVHSIGSENISLNWWFYDSGILFDPSKVLWPLTPASLIEYSRHVEYFLAEQLGPTNVGPFMDWWLAGEKGPREKVLEDRWRLMRNYILFRLTQLPRGAGPEVLRMLDPRRWLGLRVAAGRPKALLGFQDTHGLGQLLEGLKELSSGLLRCSMTGQTYRALGQAVDVIPFEKLRMYLECCEDVLEILQEHTDWDQTRSGGQDKGLARPEDVLFSPEESRRAPLAVLRGLKALSELASAEDVEVHIVDNGFFANWLQVLDARLFARPEARVLPKWKLTGEEREFNYGEPGDDIFAGLFESPVEAPKSSQSPEEEPFAVRSRQNLLLVNVFRGRFLQGPRASSRRRLYHEAAKTLLRPRQELLKQRDEVLAQVERAPGVPVIGIHKRVDNPGTARMQLAQYMPSTQAFVSAVKRLAQQRAPSEALASQATVVLATDDEAAVKIFRTEFGDRLVVRDNVKRTGGGIDPQTKLPIEVHGQRGERLTLQDAQDCLLDAMLIASCDAFVHADSNVTIAAGILNPEAQAAHVRDLVPDAAIAGEWPGYRRCQLPI